MTQIVKGGQMLPQNIAEAWFGPGNPIPPVAPPGTPPRVRSYRYNENIQYDPRKRRFNYAQLRNLADACYPLRIIAERFKARIASHDWEFRLKANPGEPKDALLNRSHKDTRVNMLTKLFQQPDGEHDWPEWIKGWLEDNIVIDAACIWADRDSKDKIARLPLLDGSTINRVIDASAMTPMPPYIAYQQIIHGLPAIDLMFDDVLFTIENYRPHKEFGFSTVEQTALLIDTQLNRAVWTLNHYTEGNIPEVFILMDGEKYSAEQITEFMQNFEAKLDGQLGQRQKVYPLPDGTVHELRGKELFEGFDEFMMRIFSYQIGEPVTPLVKGNNRAEAKQIDDTREEAGEIPKLKFVATKMNRLVQSKFFFGFEDIEFGWREAETTNALEQAQIWQITVPLGIDTVDEARWTQGKAALTPEQQQQLAAMKTPAPSPNPGEDGEPGDAEEKVSKSQKKSLLFPSRRNGEGFMTGNRPSRY